MRNSLDVMILVFFQNFGGNFLREGRVGELCLNLPDLSADGFQFLGATRALGGEVNQAGGRQKKLAQRIARTRRSFGRLIVRDDFDVFCVEQQFEHFHLGGGQRANGLENEFQFLRRV